MTERPDVSWTMERFLDEEFGPPMLLRVARVILEAERITEALGSGADTPPTRARLRQLIDQLAETAQLHHWVAEDDILADLAALALREGAGDDLLRPMRAGLHDLESRLQARLLTTVAQNWRRETPR
jgi:hypothetical protein